MGCACTTSSSNTVLATTTSCSCFRGVITIMTTSCCEAGKFALYAPLYAPLLFMPINTGSTLSARDLTPDTALTTTEKSCEGMSSSCFDNPDSARECECLLQTDAEANCRGAWELISDCGQVWPTIYETCDPAHIWAAAVRGAGLLPRRQLESHARVAAGNLLRHMMHSRASSHSRLYTECLCLFVMIRMKLKNRLTMSLILQYLNSSDDENLSRIDVQTECVIENATQ